MVPIGGSKDEQRWRDPELAIIKARKMKQFKEKAALIEKIKEAETKTNMTKIDDKEIVLKYLYDRGDEVLRLAEAQYPVQTEIIIKSIADLIKSKEIDSLISEVNCWLSSVLWDYVYELITILELKIMENLSRWREIKGRT